MQKGDHLSTILRSNKTVFSSKDIALLWHEPNTAAVWERLHYYIQKGDLYRIRNGYYAKNKNYSKLELATRILTPAYVSFETILAKEGLIFQYYEPIFVASYATRELTVDQQVYSFRKIKEAVLTDSSGVIITNETSIASRERAFLDMLYVKMDYHFDNLRSLNWDTVFQTLPIYNNQRMTKKVNQLYKNERPTES
jgi:hypothetical protein